MDVSKLNERLRKIKKEIKDIQEKCPHKEQEIKFIDQRGQTSKEIEGMSADFLV